MTQEVTEKQKKQPIIFYRLAYAVFLLLVIFYVVRGDLENATINMGIALIFDPFDAEVKWRNRPLYQRVWLLAHVAITFAGFIYMILQ